MASLQAIWFVAFSGSAPLWLQLTAQPPAPALGGRQWWWAWLALGVVVLLFFWGFGGGWRRNPGPGRR